MPSFHPRVVTWNGIEYSSIKAAAVANFVTPATMWHRVRKGYACDNDLYQYNPTIWNGIEYPSIRAAARAIGISDAGLIKRLKRGYKSDADLKKTA